MRKNFWLANLVQKLGSPTIRSKKVSWRKPQLSAAAIVERLESRALLAAGPLPVGTETLVNTYTTGFQSQPAVAMDSTGDYVVVWKSQAHDNPFYGIYAQRYSAAGAVQGAAFRVNSYTSDNASDPAIAMDAAGDFVVTWTSALRDGSGTGVYAQRFNSAGAAVGSDFRVNTTTSNNQQTPSIAMDASGSFVISWESYGQAAVNFSVYAQRYSAAGAPLGTEFKVTTATQGSHSSVAMDAAGDFTVTWQMYTNGNPQYAIYAQRYNAGGAPVGAKFKVNSYTTFANEFPSIAMDAAGDFTIVWDGSGPDGFANGISAQRYNSAGVPLGGQFVVNTHTTNTQIHPRITMNPSGDFVVTWESYVQDGSRYGVYAQRYNAAGVAQGIEFRVNTYTTNSQKRPAIATDTAGDFVVAWESYGQDGSKYGVYSQRYKPVASANIPPSGMSNTVTTIPGTAYTFKVADFGFSDTGNVPPNAFLAVRVATLPGLGSLTDNGASILNGTFIPVADLTAGKFKYVPPSSTAKGSPLTSFTFQIQDNGGTVNGGSDIDPTAKTMTVNVTATANAAPIGTANTVTMLQNTAYAFKVTDFGFSDPNNSPPNTLLAVKITTLTTDGSLTDNGIAVTTGAKVPLADITAGKFKFAPATNATGAAYAGFTFQVQDNGGTAGGGVDTDPTPRKMTISVSSMATPVNAAPIGTPKTVTTAVNTSYIFKVADFGFSDPNNTPPNSFLNVKITTLPTTGIMYDSGNIVTPGLIVPATGIAAGQLIFVSFPNATGAPYSSFTFQVQDNGGTANGGVNTDPTPRKMTVNVGSTSTPVNAAPIGTPSTVTTVQNIPYVFKVADFGFSDPNSNPQNSFLAVKIATKPGVGSLTNNGAAVIAGSVVTAADITAGKLKFTPAADASGATYASFNFQVQDNGGTANGGIDTDSSPRAMTISVTPIAVNTETRVNTYTKGDQYAPSVASDSHGDYVVAWTSYGQDGSDYGVYAQRFNAAGVSQGGEFRVNTYTASRQRSSTVAMDASGNFVIAWESYFQDGSGRGIYAQRYNAAGVAQGTEFRVNTYTGLDQSDPAVAMNASGAFVISWDSSFEDGDLGGVYAQRFNINGTRNGGEFRVNTFTTSSQERPSAAIDAAGDIVITWESVNQDGSAVGVYAQRYNAAGSTVGSEFQVNTYTIHNQSRPSVAMNSAGTFVITWESFSHTTGKGYDIYAQSYSASGVAQGSEFKVNAFIADDQSNPRIATDTAGDFVIVWENVGEDGSSNGIYARRYNASGIAQGGELQVNTYTTNAQYDHAVAMDAAGDIVVAWDSFGQDGSGYGVYARQYFTQAGSANYAPVGTPTTVTTLINTAYTFNVANFGFTDPNNNPPNSLLSVKITTLPLVGSLKDNGVAVVAGTRISLADITAGKLKYTPATSGTGAAYASFQFQVQDNGGTASGGIDTDPTPRTVTVAVQALVNHAPTGALKTVTTAEGVPYLFKTTDFGFSDPSNNPPNAFLAVKVDTLPLQGSLTDNGVAVTVGTYVTVADITAGRFVFAPQGTGDGVTYGSFNFQVEDNGGTAGGGADTDPTPRKMTISVPASNTAPVGTPNTVTTIANLPYSFNVTDFGFTDPFDTPPNQLLAVKITSLPLLGKLTDGGVVVTAGASVSATDITAGKLTFTPAANGTGAAYASFTFQVQDNGGTVNGGSNTDPTPCRMTISVGAAVSTITLGATVGGTLTPASATQFYTFSATAGQIVYFHEINLTSTDTTNSAGGTKWTLLDPYGNQVFQTTFGYNGSQGNDAGRFKLPNTGTYNLAIAGGVPSNGTTQFIFALNVVTDTTTAVSLNTAVSSSLTMPGQQNNSTFTLSAPTVVWFDSQTYDNDMFWTLTGQQGVVRNQTTFSGDDQNLGLLPAGNYTLMVSGRASHTGPFAFNLLSTAGSIPVTPGSSGTPTGQTVSGVLNPPNSAKIYRFSASAGDQLSFHNVSNTAGTNALWTLLDPWGAVLFNNYLASDQNAVALKATGSYLLVANAPIYATVATNFSFQVNFVSHATPALTGAALTLGTLYSNSTNPIGASGEVDFQFNLAAATSLLFDSQTYSSSISWQLSGPQGFVRTPTAGPNPTRFDSDDQNLGLLPLGPYSLKVFGSAGSAYAFRLLNLAAGNTITPGTAVSDTLNPANTVQVYHFTGTAGQSLYFDTISFTSTDTNGGVYPGYVGWTLLDPFGTQIFSQEMGTNGNPQDAGRFKLPNAGNYTLILQGRAYSNGSTNYQFNAIPVSDPTTALTLNTLVSDSLTIPSEKQNYTFNLAAPTALYFASQTNDNGVYWTLTGPKGIVQSLDFNWGSANLIGDGRSVGLMPAGSYTLTVAGHGAYLAPYQFNLMTLPNATPITPGTVVTGTLNPINATHLYQFQGTAQQSLYFNSLTFTSTDTSNRGGSATWMLLDPYGNKVFWTFIGGGTQPLDAGRFTLTNSGTYTLVVQGLIDDGPGTSSYSFNVAPVHDVTTPLTLDSAVTGSVTGPGQRQNYTFTLATPTALWFSDGFGHENNLNWQLTGPQGTIINPVDFNVDSVQAISLLQSGLYTITVKGSGATTGAYSFNLRTLNSATPVTPGNSITTSGVTASGALDTGTPTNLFSFSASAGDVYTIHNVNTSMNPNGFWELVDPWGKQIAGGIGNALFADLGNITLLATGTYTVVVDAPVQATTSTAYQFQVNFVSHTDPGITGTTIAFGTVYNDTTSPIGGSGEVDYQFTLTAATRLWFDSLTNNQVSMYWQLNGPQGIVQVPVQFNGSDQNLGLLQPGTYSLKAFGAAGTAYAFRLLNLANSIGFVPGTATSGTLNPGNSTQLYHFTAAAGQIMYFNSISFSSTSTGANGYADWRLYDSYGTQVFSTELGTNGTPTDAGLFTLTTGGVYTLVMLGRIDANGITNFKFNAIPVTNTTTALTLNTPVVGSVPSAGQANSYTFNLSSPASLWFDSQTPTGSVNWRLTGPQGIVYPASRFSDDDADIGLVPAGTYTLTVLPFGSDTGPYAFNLIRW